MEALLGQIVLGACQSRLEAVISLWQLRRGVWRCWCWHLEALVPEQSWPLHDSTPTGNTSTQSLCVVRALRE